jgi:putative hydrolase of the HAD superfamily
MSSAVIKAVGTWIFDLDNTLYPAESGLFGQVEERILVYIERHLGLDRQGARDLRQRYFKEHLTTMRGLILNDGIDAADFLDFVHDIDLSVLAPDPALDRALGDLSGRKAIFTNASTSHAENVLRRLGLARHFDFIFDIASADFVPKPDIGVYRRLCRENNIRPTETAMIDDMERNLVPAHELGMTTVLVKTETQAIGQADYIHHRTENLAAFLAAQVTNGKGAQA